MKACSVCKIATPIESLRIRWDDSAYGGCPTMTCRPCHEKECDAIRAESKRFRMRLTVQRWEKLEAVRD